MSVEKAPSSNYKYQASTLRTKSYNPKVINAYSTSTLKTNQYSRKNQTLISLNENDTNINPQNSLNIFSQNYSYQDECPEVNVIFFDSNLQKYRIDSLGITQIISKSASNSMGKIKYNSNTFSKSFNFSNNYKPLKTLNYSQNQSASTYKRGENKSSISNTVMTKNGKINTLTLSSNRSINQGKNERLSSSQNISSLNGRLNQSQNIITSSSQNKTSYSRPIKNQKITLSKISSTSYGRRNQDQNFSSSSQNRAIIGNSNQNKAMTFSENIRVNQTEKNKYQSQRTNPAQTNINSTNKREQNERLDILKRVNNQEQKYQNSNLNQHQNKKTNEVKNNGSYNLRDAKTTISDNIKSKDAKTALSNPQGAKTRYSKDISKTQENSNIKDYKPLSNTKDNTNIRNTKEILSNTKKNTSVRKAKTVMENINQPTNSREAKTKLSFRKEANLKETKPAYNNENKNTGISEEKNIYSNIKENQQLKTGRISQKKGENSIKQQYEKELNEKRFSNRGQQQKGYNEKVNIDEEEDKNQNVEIVNKNEEKTIIVLPGQTIEPKTITETFENPIVETIENEDGTTSSIIKQTKITTISENVPIGNNKVKAIEGAPELPMVKQYITYEYKTVSSLKESKAGANFLKPQNKRFEEDFRDDYARKNIENNEEDGNSLSQNEEMDNEKENINQQKEENEFEEDIQIYGKTQGENKRGKKEENEKKQGKGIQLESKELKNNQKSNKKSKKIEDNKGSKKTEGNKLNEELGESKSRQKNDMKSGKKETNKNEFEEKSNQKNKTKSIPKEFSKIESEGKNPKKFGSKLGKYEEDINIEKVEKKQDELKESKISKKNKGNKDIEQKPLDMKKGNILRGTAGSVENNLKNKASKLSEGQKSQEEKEIEEIIRKGDNASSGEKQKRFKFLSGLYAKCCQGNKSDSEKNLEKLGGYLLIFEEKARKDIISQLHKFLKNEEMYQKLLLFVSKKYGLKQKSQKGEEKSSSLKKNYNYGLETEQGKMSLKKSRKKEEEIGAHNEFIKSLNFDWDNKKISFKKEKKETRDDINLRPISMKLYEQVEVKDIAPLKFEGLFLEITNYDTGRREKNPFEGPSPFNQFYKERKKKIKKKIVVESKEDNVKQDK